MALETWAIGLGLATATVALIIFLGSLAGTRKGMPMKVKFELTPVEVNEAVVDYIRKNAAAVVPAEDADPVAVEFFYDGDETAFDAAEVTFDGRGVAPRKGRS